MDDYHLIQQIGEGSFGRVYKARRKFTGRLVAIKLISKLGQSKDDLLSFKREIEILKKIHHPHIMRMLNIFETDTDFCLVSELARGDLFQIIDDNQTLPENVLKNISAQLIYSLAYLHKNRIIHRDMKPQNILITGKGSVKLCDFGFARALSYTTLFLNSIKGTPLYMAPELVQEQRYDEKIDTWSLGIILYELYYGQPPFYTNSIYKLIQMIVNDDIQWPGPISKEFQNFLLRMLQKNPEQRASCEDLLLDPFIINVNLNEFDDKLYQFKSKQFDEAINESFSELAPIKFIPQKSKKPDYQSIFVNPKVRNQEELLSAVKYLKDIKVTADSPLAASFSFHFNEFISKKNCLEDSLIVATDLLILNSEKFLTPFSVGISILSLEDMPLISIPFLTQLLVIPFVTSLINASEFNLVDLHLDNEKSEKLRDRLLSFLFSTDIEIVEQTYTFLAFLSQESDIFLESLSNSFAPQFLPMIANAIIYHQSFIVKSSAFCLLSRIIDKNNSSINFIQPINQFIDVLVNIINYELTDINSFCVFSSSISFIAVSLKLISNLTEFQKKFSIRSSLSNLHQFVFHIFNGNSGILNRLDTLLTIGETIPQNHNELLCYVGILSSPFSHIPLDNNLIDLCIKNIENLLPFHQPPLLNSLFNLDTNIIINILPELLKLFNSPTNANVISEYIIKILSLNINLDNLLNVLCKADYLIIIPNLISELGPSIPPTIVYAWSQVIHSFKDINPILLKSTPIILNSLFNLDSAAETSLMIAAHLSRLSSDFIPLLNNAGAISLAERALQSEALQIKLSALTFFGNYCKKTSLNIEDENRITNLILLQILDENLQIIKQSLFSLANLIVKNPNVSNIIMIEINSIIKLLNSNDLKIIENTAGLIGNILRCDKNYLNPLIEGGVIEALLNCLIINEDLGGKCILQLAVFCQYDYSRNYLSKKKPQNLIQKYCNSQDQRVKKYANAILESL